MSSLNSEGALRVLFFPFLLDVSRLKVSKLMLSYMTKFLKILLDKKRKL